MIRVIVCEPGAVPEVREIREELRDWQHLVGGSVEAKRLVGPIHFYCNEDGLMEHLPANRVVMGHFIVGTFFVARLNGTEVVSLTDKDIAHVLLILLGEHR